MKTDDLLLLADFLEAEVEEEHFYMGSWFFMRDIPDFDNDEERIWYENNELTLNGCGTTACAMGWATRIPEFAQRGLRLDLLFDAPVYEGHYGIDAATKFFDINQSTADFLFLIDRYCFNNSPVGPKDVAKRIRRVVNQYLEGEE